MAQEILRSHFARLYPITTRWHDNDVYGHVNNVVYYSFFDTSANRFLIEECGLRIETSPVIAYVVASQCEYHSPVAYPSNIEVGFRVKKLGNSSASYEFGVFSQKEQACALGAFTHVFVERESGRSVSIPEEIKSQLQKAIVPIV